MGKQQEKYDLIIMGGGIAGLMAALVAGQIGRRVLLLEKEADTGGSVRGFRRGGRYYPFGLSLLGSLSSGGVLRRFLSFTGVLDSLDCITFPDGEIFSVYEEVSGKFQSVSGDLDRFREMLVERFPREADNIRLFLDAVRDAGERNIFHRSAAGGARPDLMEMFLDSGDTLGQRLSIFSDDELKRLLLSFTVLFGVFPEDVPFYVYANSVISYFEGVCTIRGGGEALVEAIGKRLQALGVTVLTGSPVTDIRIAEGRIAAVATADGVFRAERYICTMEPKAMVRLFSGEPLRPRFLDKLTGYRDGISVSGVYFRIKGERVFPESGDYRNYVPVCTDILSDLAAFEAATADELVRYTSVFLNTDNGDLQLYAVMPDNYAHYEQWKSRPPEYLEAKKRLTEAITARVARMLPEFSGRLEPELSFTPLTVENYLGYSGGSILGVYSSVRQKGLQTILPFTPVKNLYLAGQNVFLPGVVGALSSVLAVMMKLEGPDILDRLRD